MKPKTLSQEQEMITEFDNSFKEQIEGGDWHDYDYVASQIKPFLIMQLQKAKDATWKEMKDELLSYLAEGRELEVAALEASKLVPDKHYHKGKIHLIDEIIENIS